MFRAIAGFELTRQLRGHVFWVVCAISFAMVLGSVSVDALRVGVHPAGLRNGAEAIVLTHAVWTLFFMFTTAAFVADAVLQDELFGFGDIIAALPLRRRDYLYGRFAGAFAAVLLCFASVPLGLMVGAAMPWVAADSVGPLQPGAFVFACLVIALPNLMLSASVGFVLATLSRSMSAALVGAIALLTLYALGARSGAVLPPVLEPFGFAAYAQATEGWSAAARDVSTPGLTATLLTNRLLVCGVSVVLLVLAGCRRTRSGAPRRTSVAKTTLPPPHFREAHPSPVFDRLTPLRQFNARIRLECAQTIRTPVFIALLLLGLVNALSTIWPIQREAADAIIRALEGAFQLTPTVMALFFSGELRWNEEERRIDAILLATPIAPSAFMLPKFAALAAVLVGTLAVAALASGGALLAHGRSDAATSIPGWWLSACYDALTFAALAMFLQTVAPNKLSGWGFTVLYLIASLALDRLGWSNPAYRYARYPAEAGAMHQFGWSIVALLLLLAVNRLGSRRGHT